MPRTLFIHIGYHKSGSTTLQKGVFPQLTKTIYLRKETPLLAPFFDAFRDTPAVWRERAETIFSRIVPSDSRNFLISSEGLSAHRLFASTVVKRSPALLASHLRECRLAARQFGFATIKVIVGIRRQDQYLGSRYASQGFLSGQPSQDDFLRQSREIIGPRYATDGILLDYETTYDVLRLAADDVLVLPLEELAHAPAQYLSALSSFFEEPLNNAPTRRRNRLVISNDCWQIRSDRIQWLTRKKPFGRFRALLAKGVKIQLTPDLKSDILATYRDSNAALDVKLGGGLKQYGYY